MSSALGGPGKRERIDGPWQLIYSIGVRECGETSCAVGQEGSERPWEWTAQDPSERSPCRHG